MNSILTEPLALDTNEYVFALQPEEGFEASYALFFQHVSKLRLFLPLQVRKEINQNLRAGELDRVWTVINQAAELIEDFTPASVARVAFWQERGAKKGDALITVQLEAANVPILVSENRHFLGQIESLPFEVISAAELLRRLDET